MAEKDAADLCQIQRHILQQVFVEVAGAYFGDVQRVRTAMTAVGRATSTCCENVLRGHAARTCRGGVLLGRTARVCFEAVMRGCAEGAMRRVIKSAKALLSSWTCFDLLRFYVDSNCEEEPTLTTRTSSCIIYNFKNLHKSVAHENMERKCCTSNVNIP